MLSIKKCIFVILYFETFTRFGPLKDLSKIQYFWMERLSSNSNLMFITNIMAFENFTIEVDVQFTT